MPAFDLCSTVFIIRPHSHFTPQQFLGRMAHKLFLSMLDHIGLEALANSLHNKSDHLPYVVSDIFPNGTHHFWLRISGLTPHISQDVIAKLATLVGQTIEVKARNDREEAPWKCVVDAVVPSQHEWARSQTYSEFVHTAWRLSRPKYFRLEFITPTAIKSEGLYRPFPMPHWVFRPLYDRFSRLGGTSLPFQPNSIYLEAYAEHFIRVEDYGMRCRKRLPMKDDKLVAFQGWIDYTLSEPNEHFGVGDHADKKLYRTEPVSTIRAHIQQHRDQYAALVHLLAQFAYYSGVGKYTGQGMGMVQLSERTGR
ncbi:MAG: CRISPR system precrRNA processing endoribonuclease RAMP protein Cas6 [Anaerolineae bacterium]|nr:CRISPR system precrRNA processing endoribonuclease RAMP protein Cas6 [Anaerolineae bacterium]